MFLKPMKSEEDWWIEGWSQCQLPGYGIIL